MPLYETLCDDCGKKQPIWRRIADRDNLPSCDACNGSINRVIAAPAVKVDIPAYISPATGKLIESRVQQENDLKASGNILMEPGLKEDIARNRERAYDKAFEPVAAGIDQTVGHLVNNGKIGTL